MAIVVIILNVTLFMPIVSARYLPTRSNDQLRRQEIKEILRLVSGYLFIIIFFMFCR